ncbi:NAD(P)H-hydrate epimerase [Nocardioides sp. Bht2]|uniref:NAD(P)H-hydrate epimerase n=1 Tax=Nocardioides sp. Bht2 TaxID=3392297 RepID=UPI0039B4FD7B
MRHAHTVAQVRDAESTLLASLPDGVLMQRAAVGLSHAIIDFLGGIYGRRVVLLVGSGDNGGDALWAGAHLARRGARVHAELLAERVHPAGLAALRAAGGTTSDGSAQIGDGSRRVSDGSADVVVDGIVGIGGRPGLAENAQRALARYAGVPMVAVDVPSGVEVDTGQLPGAHVWADLTVTFGTYKVAHLVAPAAAACGAVHLVDIGLDLPPSAIRTLQRDDVARLLPRPGAHSHKYTRGVLGVRAGSATYPGAALLCMDGANQGLAGMLRYDGAAVDAVRTRHPEVVGGGRVQAWVVGPGSGADAEAALTACLADRVPLVVDADALAFVTAPLEVPAVLTPHAGELARMLDVDRGEVEEAQLHHAREAASRFGAVVLLKGPRTVIADPSGEVLINTTGVPWLGTAGAGDVLAGVIGTLLAAGLMPWEAAGVGAWLHGAAATRAAADGPLTASVVAATLRPTIGDLLHPGAERA